MEDVTELPRKPWARTGGQGAYIQLKGMEGFTGMYVGEIPAGGALNIERHLYEKIIYILHGFGATEVWSGNNEKKKIQFEWQQGSLFAVPLNCSHRMINGSREPVIFLAVTSAPLMIDLLHDIPFVFGCNYTFDERFDGRADYFVPTSNRQFQGGFFNWESNFIADARGALVDPSEAKGYGVRITSFDMGGSTLGRSPRRVAGGTLSQSTLSYGGRDSFDTSLRRVHPHVAAGSWDTSIQIGQWRSGH